METILDKIIANKRIEVKAHKQLYNIADMMQTFETSSPHKSFKQAIRVSPSGIIAEFKRKSPSRDWIFQEAEIEKVIPFYSLKGASAISVLTDTNFFGGSLNDLQKAKELTDIPLLRKDFIIDEFQIYEASHYGASAILLIAAALSKEETKDFARTAKQLGLDILLEVHNEEELDHINEYVDIVGVNNRNLKTFVTDIQVSFDLVDKIPDEFIKISESGISEPQTVIELRRAGYSGFLMGENFMKTKNPGKALGEFIKELQ